MLRAVTILVVCVLASAGVASADNYGGVSGATRAKVTREVYRYWSGWEARRMLYIIGRESGFNPRAVNWSDANGGSHGLCQVNGIHRGTFARLWHLRYTIKAGMEMCYRLYRAAGWGPWAYIG